MTFFQLPEGEQATAEGRDSAGDAYQKRLDRANKRSQEGVLARQEIGKLPPIKDPERRERGRQSTEEFAIIYFPKIFKKKPAQYHLDLCENFDSVVSHGGPRVVAIERGGGKSAWCLAACLRALLYGFRKFAVFVGDTARMGRALQEKLVGMARTSQDLIDDFPELIVFQKATDNRKKMRCEGRPIKFSLQNKDGQTVFPDFVDCESCEAIINSTGMTGGGGRGLSYVTVKGEMIRPDLLLIDDPQNEESARSIEQTQHREEMIENSLLGIAAGDTRIAAIMAITVRNADCLASKFLDRNRHGEWHGMRYEAVPKMPTNMDLWDKFGESLRMGDTPEDGVVIARELFRKYFDEMLEGAEVSWLYNYPPEDLHALEKYMRMFYLKPDFFNCEIQQRGKRKVQAEKLTRELLQMRLNGFGRGIVPDNAAHLVAFVDTHAELLFWTVMAIANDATSWIVDYGAWPEQATRFFTLRGASRRISNDPRYQGLPEAEALIKAHLDLDEHLFRDWQREGGGGGTKEIDRMLKDCGWNSDIVESAILASAWKAKIRPSIGRTVHAGKSRVHQWKVQNKHLDNHKGPDWIERHVPENDLQRVIMDSNRWKSSVAAQLCYTPGVPGSMTIFGSDIREHQLLFDHYLAESRRPEEAGGETIDIWTNPPSHPDNHWWDCAVGCDVAGSILGALLAGQLRHDVTAQRTEVQVPDWMMKA